MAERHLDLSLDPRLEWMLRRAAHLTGSESVAQFVLDAARERAQDVIDHTVVVAPDDFDALAADLEAPPEPMPGLVRGADRPRAYRHRG